ncbi:MAG: redoxin domain-containing protein [Deltaproteobacteria bacterium]|nr:redoxin domain-containing protein [Deltaproteobacteria bacterium]
MKRWGLFLLIVGPITALLAFGLTRDPHVLPSVLVGKPAPAFQLHTLDGEPMTLAALTGHPLVINFWATWCGPCLHEHRVFRQAAETFAGTGVRFLGVVYQDSETNVREFLEQFGRPFEVLLDLGSAMAIDYGVGGVPETFFVNAQGIIREKYSGALTMEYLKQQIEGL